MANRLFYAGESILVGPEGAHNNISTSGYTIVHGLQSASIETNFNLEQVFELGQLAIYENIENIPDVTFNTEKVLDGYCPVYVLATNGSTASDLAGRSTKKCMVIMSVYEDSQKFASGVPIDSCLMSGMFPNSIGYNFPVEGNFTETISMIGNHKLWYATPSNSPANAVLFGPAEDSPLAADPSGGVNRREDIIFLAPTGTVSLDANNMISDDRVTTLPRQINGITSSGLNVKTGGVYGAHIQSISVNCNLGRDELFELGRRTPYHRFVPFPTEVTCSIETTAVGGDDISATEEGGQNGAAAGSNLVNESIRIRTREGLFLDLGTKNKIQSITYGGGDAAGGNITITYNFTNFNDLDVRHLQDPNTALRPRALQAAQLTS